MCKIMASLVCNTGLLKSTAFRLKGKTFSHRICKKCNLGILENINHLVRQCPYYSEERNSLHLSLSQIESDVATPISKDSMNYFHIIMGKAVRVCNFPRNDRDMAAHWRVCKQTL